MKWSHLESLSIAFFNQRNEIGAGSNMIPFQVFISYHTSIECLSKHNRFRGQDKIFFIIKNGQLSAFLMNVKCVANTCHINTTHIITFSLYACRWTKRLRAR